MIEFNTYLSIVLAVSSPYDLPTGVGDMFSRGTCSPCLRVNTAEVRHRLLLKVSDAIDPGLSVPAQHGNSTFRQNIPLR